MDAVCAAQQALEVTRICCGEDYATYDIDVQNVQFFESIRDDHDEALKALKSEKSPKPQKEVAGKQAKKIP